MKKILSMLLVAAAISSGTTSCSDFLEEENKTGETADLAYNTKTGIDGLLYSAYSYARGWWGKEPSLGLSEMGSDLFYSGQDNKQKKLVSYDFTSESLGFSSTSGTDMVNNNPCLDQYWELFYAGIDVTNNLIKYAATSIALSDSQKEIYTAEGLFLRALYYSQMVALWGPIPYNSVAINSANTAPVRLPEAVVYKNILDDLKSSMEKFKAQNVMKQADASGTGHASYYSAEALYARVALYAASWLGATSVEGYGNLYTEALNAATDVINNSGAAFYSRFSDTFSMRNEENNQESLFRVHYGNTLASGRDNCVPYRFAENGTGQFNSLLTRKGYSSNGGSADLLMYVSLWNNGCGDLGGNGQGTKNIFFRIAAGKTTIKSQKTGKAVELGAYYSPYGRGFTRYLPSLYLWKTLDEVKATDQRYNATLLLSYNCHPDLVENTGVAKNYPEMKNNTDYISYEDAYTQDGNYFNGGVPAIVYSLLDGDSPEGQALQAKAKNKYRLQFAYGGDIPVYTSGDMTKAIPTTTAKATSDVYGDARYNDVKISGERSFPGIKKFLDDVYEEAYPTYDISHRDIMVLRLAEMYLIKAEAEMQTGGDAIGTLNKLRAARAISGKDNSIQAVYGESSVTIETILRERAIELVGEYQRWFDLKRTHTLISHIKAYNAQGSANIALKHYYRPIPLSELETVTNRSSETVTQDDNGVLRYTATSDGMWQNPGF